MKQWNHGFSLQKKSQTVQRLYQHYLKPLDCEFKTANNAEDCIRIARDWRPDIITLGMEFPETSGIEICEQLKADEIVGMIPVVIISAVACPDLQATAFEAGVIEYIIKPCSPCFLKQRIESILDPIETHYSNPGDERTDYTVLVAENCIALKLLYQYQLSQLNCKTIICPDGLEAWQTICKRPHEIDLIICAMNMPNMDGRELAKRIRSDSSFDQIPLIMSSKVQELLEIKALLHLGANDYLTKPFSHEEFAARVRAHLRTRVLMHEQKHLKNKLSQMNNILEERVKLQTLDIREANLSAIYMLAMASNAKDSDTENQAQRVRFYSEALASKLGFDESEAQEIGYASMLRDVGKLAIPDPILQNPEKLDDKELAIMRTHPEQGARMLGKSAFFKTARELAHCHHERFDGSGYPRQLAGESIPIAARIVAVADVYDTLSSKQVDEAAWNEEEISIGLINISGTHLDPNFVNIFLECIHNGTVTKIKGRYSTPSPNEQSVA
ncbi:MAG: response regulator [Myxococcota bacterium]|nr:response regulator [Myxococcota bacterium]